MGTETTPTKSSNNRKQKNKKSTNSTNNGKIAKQQSTTTNTPPSNDNDNNDENKKPSYPSWLNTAVKILFNIVLIQFCRPEGQKQLSNLYQNIKSVVVDGFSGSSDTKDTSSSSSSPWIDGDVRDVPERLLLASHKNLIWYDIQKDRYRELNNDFRVYYGMFPGGRGGENEDSVWVATSKLNTEHHREIKDMLVQFNATDGSILQRRELPSTFTHDMAVSYDAARVFVLDTAHGSIHVFSYPNLEFLKTIEGLFTARDHINTVAPTPEGTLWISMLNHGGHSYMVEIDPQTEERVCTLHGIGNDNHGLVRWNDNFFLSLSSSAASLVKIRIPKYCRNNQHQRADVTRLWTYAPESAREKLFSPKKFLKGLVVLNEVAYFGMSDYQTTREKRMNSKCSLVAYDLRDGRMLWIRPFVGARGLLNIIGVPHLGIDHTYRVQSTQQIKQQQQEEEDDDDSSSCVHNYMNLVSDSKHYGPAFGRTGKSSTYFIDLPLRFNVDKLREETYALERKYNWTYRADVNNHFILLATQYGRSTDQSIRGPFYPVEGRLDSSPYLRRVLDSFGSLIGRSRFMMLKAGETITRHYDQTSHIEGNNRAPVESGYWGRRFRVHIPIRTDQTVIFSADDSYGSAEIHMKEGHAYLFDNSIYHSVVNPTKDMDRIHLIFDTIGSVELYRLIQKSRIVVANSKQRSYWDTEEKEDGIAELLVNVTTDDDTEAPSLLYENFTDAPVFVPMSPDAVYRAMITNVQSLISSEEPRKERADQLLNNFVKEWGSCYKNWRLISKRTITPKLRQAELYCKRLGERLVKDIVRIDECHADGPMRLTKTTSMTLSTVVESFTRMMFYECQGWNLYSQYYTEGPPCSRIP